MQMILSTTRLIQHQRVLRELEAKFSFQKCVLGTTAALGPLHMSPLTGLARLPGRILWSVHMGNCSPVTGMKFKKQNQNSET